LQGPFSNFKRQVLATKADSIYLSTPCSSFPTSSPSRPNNTKTTISHAVKRPREETVFDGDPRGSDDPLYAPRVATFDEWETKPEQILCRTRGEARIAKATKEQG